MRGLRLTVRNDIENCDKRVARVPDGPDEPLLLSCTKTRRAGMHAAMMVTVDSAKSQTKRSTSLSVSPAVSVRRWKMERRGYSQESPFPRVGSFVTLTKPTAAALHF